MDTFLITYNINADDNDIGAKVAGQIRKHPKWARVTAATWIVKANAKPTEVRDNISQILGEKGNVAVFKINDASWATYAIGKDVTDWMKENI